MAPTTPAGPTAPPEPPLAAATPAVSRFGQRKLLWLSAADPGYKGNSRSSAETALGTRQLTCLITYVVVILNSLALPDQTRQLTFLSIILHQELHHYTIALLHSFVTVPLL